MQLALEPQPFGMELFLNLCWLSLLAPAYLLWRRTFGCSRNFRGTRPPVPPLVFLCVLGCVLVVLFPVISASDDLHAMRAEMEESSPCKRSVGEVGGEKASVSHSRCPNLCAVAVMAAALGLTSETRQAPLTISLLLPAAPLIPRVGRAPPDPLLG
jgi:hypothetical protein